jgi:hypothetical protein
MWPFRITYADTQATAPRSYISYKIAEHRRTAFASSTTWLLPTWVPLPRAPHEVRLPSDPLSSDPLSGHWTVVTVHVTHAEKEGRFSRKTVAFRVELFDPMGGEAYHTDSCLEVRVLFSLPPREARRSVGEIDEDDIIIYYAHCRVSCERRCRKRP